MHRTVLFTVLVVAYSFAGIRFGAAEHVHYLVKQSVPASSSGESSTPYEPPVYGDVDVFTEKSAAQLRDQMKKTIDDLNAKISQLEKNLKQYADVVDALTARLNEQEKH